MSSDSPSAWFLEGFIDERRDIWRSVVSAFPFRVGRLEGSSLRLASPEVSGHHAELMSKNGDLWIRDLGSKNGSYVNGLRVTDETRLRAGDVLRFATWEFRLVHDGSASRTITQTMVITTSDGNLASMVQDLQAIIDERRVTCYYQPIVSMQDGELLAFEALGRGVGKEGTVVSPGHLFELAASLRREAELSVMLRDQAMKEAHGLPKVGGEVPALFVNTHPAELASGADELLRSLAELRRSAPGSKVVLEIHEAAIADRPSLMALAAGLKELDVDLAFDDFGTGQARLLELLDVAPKYLKFDRAWISDVHTATQQRLDMLRSLVTMVRDLGVATLAEGVEKIEEAEVCRDLGFELAQGFHFGRPAPANGFH